MLFGEDPNVDPITDEFEEQAGDIVDAGIEIESARLKGLASGEGEDLGGELGGAVGLFGNFLKAIVSAGTGLRILEAHFRPAKDGAEEVVEVVRDAAGEATDGFKFLQLKDLMFEFLAFAALLGFAHFALDSGEETLEMAFDEVVLRAIAETQDGGGFVEGAGDEDERNVGVAGADNLEGLQAGEAGHGVVGDDEIPFAMSEGLQQSGGGIDTLAYQVKTAFAELALDELAIVFRVFDDNGAE
jgi:hypothetical protein